MARRTFLEFFAGGGMARAGLGDGWECLFANDFNAMKAATYVANWGAGDMKVGDVAQLALADLPDVAVDLAWASFPCQDLSLAGGYRGLGHEQDDKPTRSGTFWPFWNLIRQLAAAGRAPKLIVLENVYGVLTSHGGRDFSAIGSAIAEAGYRFGALVINASHFVPQSRPRVFFIAARQDLALPAKLQAREPNEEWRPTALAQAHARLPRAAKEAWIWWNLPSPPLRNTRFADLIEEEPRGVSWRSATETERLLALMTPLHRAKVREASEARARRVGAVYRRTRVDAAGQKVQRADVRFDDLAGCLRTPAGGSSRQTILVVETRKIRSRLLSPREAARLMGLSDAYILPERYNDAYHVCGDGVCVPVVRHLAQYILEPLLGGSRRKDLAAAE